MTPEEEQEEQKQLEQEQEQALSSQQVPFTREDLINAHMLRNTDAKQPFHDHAEQALIYVSAQRAVDLIIDNYFSDNRFLTNLSDGKVRNDILGTNLDLERDMIFATASFCPSDLRNSDLTNLMTNILSHNRPTTLRAKGPDRERRLNNKISMSQESTLTRIENPLPQAQMPQQKKHGWLSFLGR